MHKNQNPYHMHIFDICTNDLQNKNFLAEKCRRSSTDKPCTLYADRQTDRRTDRQGETYIPPNFVCGGYKYSPLEILIFKYYN